MIAIVEIINSSTTLLNYSSFSDWIIKFQSLSKFVNYNTSSIFTIVCIRSLGLIYYTVDVCTLLTCLIPQPWPHALAATISLCFHEFDLLI